jgi:hypothetical protein
MPAHEHVCLECGTPLPRRVGVEVVDGDLKEFKGRSAAKKTKRSELADLPKGLVYAQLMSVMIERGRSTGWLAHAFREIYSTWPRGMDGIEPMEPSFEIRQFVKHKDIRYAMARRAEASHGAA